MAKQQDKYLVRSEEPFPMEIKNAEGPYLIGDADKNYIDFLSGWCVGNLGWGNEILQKAIREYDGPAYVYPHFSYKPWTELAELLASITPGKLSRSYRTTGGSESVDTALQIAMAYTGRKRFLSVEGSYHGNFISTLSITGSGNGSLKNSLSGARIKTPLDKSRLRSVEMQLKKEDVAGLIMEPIICNLGVLIPEDDFMDGIAGLCKKYDTLLIMDEVATGFGRTGKLFASEHYGLEPDILCMAKAITGGYAGMGATITTDKIAKAVKDKVKIYSTYGWHPLSVHVALANLHQLTDTREILQHANEVSDVIRETLPVIPFKGSVDVRIKGLAIGIEVSDSRYAEKIRKKCLEKGLVFTTQEQNLIFFPPLTIEKEVAKEAMAMLEGSV